MCPDAAPPPVSEVVTVTVSGCDTVAVPVMEPEAERDGGLHVSAIVRNDKLRKTMSRSRKSHHISTSASQQTNGC